MLDRRSLARRTAAVPRILFAAGCLLLFGPSVSAQTPDRYGFVIRRDLDTVVVESITRTPTRLTSAVDMRGKGMAYIDASLLPDGLVSAFALRLGDSTAAPMLAIAFGRDSVTLTQRDRGAQRVASAPGLLPHAEWSVAAAELVLRRFIALNVPSATLSATAGSPDAMSIQASRAGAGAYKLAYPEYTVELRVDARGAVTGGCVPGEGITIDRVGAAPTSCF